MRSNSRLRGTPSEGLDISGPQLMQLMVDGVAEAEKSAKWVRGFKEAAADLKEMTLDDMIYWVYETTHPVTRIEQGAEDILARGVIDRLPEGFEKQTSLTLGAGGDLLQAEGLELSKDILFADRARPIECCNHAQFETLTSHKGKYFTVMNTSNNHIDGRGTRHSQDYIAAIKRYADLVLG